MRAADITGQRFGRLVVSDRAGSAERGRHAMWRCVCDCGAQKIIAGGNLRSGAVASCGCLRRERSRERITAAQLTHGLSKHPAYNSWRNMRDRCEDPSVENWASYGGRGIRVCGRWMTFENFYADMGPTWAPGLTIERNDNDGDYEPGNCRWATRAEQNRNKRNNVWYVGPDGQRLIATDLARVLDVTYATIIKRTRAGTLPPGWSKE